MARALKLLESSAASTCAPVNVWQINTSPWSTICCILQFLNGLHHLEGGQTEAAKPCGLVKRSERTPDSAVAWQTRAGAARILRMMLNFWLVWKACWAQVHAICTFSIQHPNCLQLRHQTSHSLWVLSSANSQLQGHVSDLTAANQRFHLQGHICKGCTVMYCMPRS